MRGVTQAEIDRLEHRLRTDTPFYARTCLKIIDQRKKLVPLIYKPAQLRLDAAMERQQAAGRPIRIIVAKARKEGISTAVEAKIVHRITQNRNREALIVAHEKKKAGPAIFTMADTMYSNLPDEKVGNLVLKPPVVASRRSQELYLGEPSRVRRHEGHVGINSSLTVDTASEVETGRAATPSELHLSEVAFWGDKASKKLTTLLNSVPDEPGTLVVLESTSNGFNHWRKMCVGNDPDTSDYEVLFFAWFEEPEYTRPFMVDPATQSDEEHRRRFIDSIGTGPWGEDEPDLVEQFGLTPEQLHWRRWAIVNRCSSDLRTFHQEFPSTLDESFLASGSTVFPGVLIKKAIDSADVWDGVAERGIIRPKRYEPAVRGRQIVQVPREPIWTPEHAVERRLGALWVRIWEHPFKGSDDPEDKTPIGQYVGFLDPASGDDTEEGERAYLAFSMIDHRTREQVAEIRTHAQPGPVGEACYLLACYFNMAHLAVEVTGGYGAEIARTWWWGWHYPHVYFRKPKDRRNQEKHSDRLGWQTDPATKGMMITHFNELLRTDRHGVRSKYLASELTTFIRENNKEGPEADSHSDILMAHMGAQRVADEIPLRSEDMARVKAKLSSGHVEQVAVPA